MPSAQTPPHLRHHYHQVVEFSHSDLPIGWTRSPRIWTSVMSVVVTPLHRHGTCTLLYVDDLLIVCYSFEEDSRVRQIIEDTFLAAGIVRESLKGCFDTPTQTLSDHLGFIISSIGKGSLRVPERRCFALRRQARELLFQISEKSSTRKSSTSQDPSCLQQPSTTCSFGATFPTTVQKTCKIFGQINHLLSSTPTHREPQAGVRCWICPTRQRDRSPDGGCHKK